MSDDNISFYIPVRNAERTLPDCIEAVRSQTRPADELFILLDRRSSDRTVDIARASGISIVEQHGFSLGAARNEAIAAARHRWLACCDSDVVIDRDWLARLAARRDEAAAGIGGRTLERIKSPFDDWRALNLPHHWGEHPFRNPFMLVSEVLFDRHALLSIGGYRNDLNYYEDSDLCQRLRDAGYDLFYEPAAVATHLRMDSLHSLLALRWKYSEYRQRPLLDTFKGLLKKIEVNREYATTTLSRMLARGREELAYISFLLFFHHLKADLQSMFSRRPLLPSAVIRFFEGSLIHHISSALQPHEDLAARVIADLEDESGGISSQASTGARYRAGGQWEQLSSLDSGNACPPLISPGWSIYANGVESAIQRFRRELSAEALAVIQSSADFIHEQISIENVRRLSRVSPENLQIQLAAETIQPFVDHSFCLNIREQWPEAEGVRVIGALTDAEHMAVRDVFPSLSRDAARTVMMAAHLEADVKPLRVYDELPAEATRLVVAYQPPERFVAGLDIPSAGELASAAAAAGWTIERFDTLVGRTRLVLSRVKKAHHGDTETRRKGAEIRRAESKKENAFDFAG